MKKKNNVAVDKLTKYKKQKMLALLCTSVVFIGAATIGVLLILSEVLYYKIEQFSLLPLWYRITMYASLFTVLGGLIGCGFTKNRLNTTNNELTINVVLFLFGFAVSFFFGLWRTEAYWKDVLICIGGAISSVGLFCGITSLIGLSKKSKSGFALLLKSYARERKTSSLHLSPARLTEIIEVENYFNTMLPAELVDFLSEFNGDGEFLYPTNQIIEVTKLFRENFKDSERNARDLCFIGQDGEGNHFCYKILEDGTISDDLIYCWVLKSDALIPVADTLRELIYKYYSGLIDVDSGKKQINAYREYNKFVDWWSDVNEKSIENNETLFGAYQIMWYYNEIANGGFDQFWDFAENNNWDLEKTQQTFKNLLTENQFSLFTEALEAHKSGQDCEKYNARFDYNGFEEHILPQIAKTVVGTLEK
ncbi:MAG: SMI1/KNR4 family protein [Candidatus Scatosoma sp.]